MHNGKGGRKPEYKIGPYLGTYTKNTSTANAPWSTHSDELPPKWSSGITRTRSTLIHARIYDVYTSYLTPTCAPAPSSAETGQIPGGVRPRATGSSGTQLAGSTLETSSTQASQKKKRKKEQAKGLRDATCEATMWCIYRARKLLCIPRSAPNTTYIVHLQYNTAGTRGWGGAHMPCGLSTHSGVAMMGYPTGVVGGKDGLPNRCEAHTSYRIRPWQQQPFLEMV